MTRIPIAGATREERERRAHNLAREVELYIRRSAVDWSPDPPELVFEPDLSPDELAIFAFRRMSQGEFMALTAAQRDRLTYDILHALFGAIRNLARD